MHLKIKDSLFNFKAREKKSFPIMKIGLLGTPVSSPNQGVRALRNSLVSLLKNGESEIYLLIFTPDNHAQTIELFSGEKIIKTPVIHYRLSPLSSYRDHFAWIFLMAVFHRILPSEHVRVWIRTHTPWIDELNKCGFAGSIHGGDSFSDIYGFMRFMLSFFESSTVLLVKGTMV